MENSDVFTLDGRRNNIIWTVISFGYLHNWPVTVTGNIQHEVQNPVSSSQYPTSQLGKVFSNVDDNVHRYNEIRNFSLQLSGFNSFIFSLFKYFPILFFLPDFLFILALLFSRTNELGSLRVDGYGNSIWIIAFSFTHYYRSFIGFVDGIQLVLFPPLFSVPFSFQLVVYSSLNLREKRLRNDREKWRAKLHMMLFRFFSLFHGVIMRITR